MCSWLFCIEKLSSLHYFYVKLVYEPKLEIFRHSPQASLFLSAQSFSTDSNKNKDEKEQTVSVLSHPRNKVGISVYYF